MKLKFYYLAWILSGITLFTACNDDDDDYSLDKYIVDVATVENPDNQSAFFFTLDDGTQLWTAASYFPDYRPKDGQRILADFTLLSEMKESSRPAYNVRLNNYYNILTKGIFNVGNMEEQDSIGHDAINVRNMWIGSDYLNVEFAYPGGSKTHYINLVRNNLVDYFPDGKVHLEFRHNANEDPYNYALWGMASFDLRSLQMEGRESLPIMVHWSSFDSPAGKTAEFDYRFNHDGNQPVKFDFKISGFQDSKISKIE